MKCRHISKCLPSHLGHIALMVVDFLLGKILHLRQFTFKSPWYYETEK